jgi:hypothetical protein
VSKRVNSRLWKGNTYNPPSQKKFKSRNTGILMLTDFWNSQGPVLEYYKERGITRTVFVTVRLRITIKRCSAVARQ